MTNSQFSFTNQDATPIFSLTPYFSLAIRVP